MTATAIRRRLFEYIRFADEKKVKAIYAILEQEINEKHDIWTEELAKEMDRRASEIESGKVKGIAWKDVKAHAKALLKKRK